MAVCIFTVSARRNLFLVALQKYGFALKRAELSLKVCYTAKADSQGFSSAYGN
jgi:hypothetical protein